MSRWVPILEFDLPPAIVLGKNKNTSFNGDKWDDSIAPSWIKCRTVALVMSSSKIALKY